MPPVSEGSRSALVAWTVVVSIIGVTATILAVYFYVDSTHVNDRLKTLTGKYDEVVADAALSGPDVQALKEARNDSDNPFGITGSMKFIDVAMYQRNGLSKIITGSDSADPAKAGFDAATRAIQKAKGVGAKPAGQSLVAAIDALVAEVQARTTEAENNKKDSEASKTKLGQTVAATEAQINALQENVQRIRSEKDKALAELAEARQQQQRTFQTTADDLRKQLQTAQDQINTVNAQNAELASQVRNLETELDRTRQRLNEVRIDPTQAVVRQPDGKIVRLPGGNIAFIDLGAGNQITPGLTFEVFDKIDGIPQPGDPATEENLPAGKASLEVLRVGPTSSECRITRLAPAAALSEGDLIVNLVYDKNTKYSFLVYGNFDLDQNGVATAQDAEVIKRLITQWGARLTSEMNVDTDFVVLGKEPVVPDRPKEDDLIARAKYDTAIAEAEAYAEISTKARAYRIPILNQNRFLYLIGYYDQAKR